jgi:hypothetical protein
MERQGVTYKASPLPIRQRVWPQVGENYTKKFRMRENFYINNYYRFCIVSSARVSAEVVLWLFILKKGDTSKFDSHYPV